MVGMIVDEGEFAEMAENLGMDAEKVVNTILNCVKSRAWYVHRTCGRRSLDKALETTINGSEITYAWDEALKRITGGREYVVEEAEVDLQRDSVWYGIVFPEGVDSEINRLDLYFGSDSGEVVHASVDAELSGGELEKALEEIYTEVGSTLHNCDDADFEHDCEGRVFSFSITAHTGRDFYLPGFDQTNDLVKKIKEIARSHDVQD